MESKIKKHYKKIDDKSRIVQGDIYRNISFKVIGYDGNDIIVDWKYAVVLTQDCDLTWDYEARKVYTSGNSNDKFLQTILICPAFNYEELCNGEHIDGWKMRTFESSKKGGGPREKLVNNDEFKRYHFLHDDGELKIPSFVIDFKLFNTVPRELLYSLGNDNYIGTIEELFRESLVQRFTNFIGRIPLPEL
ncbi:MAG: hypothetical protein PHS49_00535 [Candidatus Gracilibacteria bacterium]|nr:hypothetical protein [Candidatus Gracilibacteria bacterium]